MLHETIAGDGTLRRSARVYIAEMELLMTILRMSAVVGLGAALGVVLVAQAPLPDVERFGPQVGEVVPDFSLVDQTGRTRDLSSIMGPNGAMLVFSRSAAW